MRDARTLTPALIVTVSAAATSICPAQQTLTPTLAAELGRVTEMTISSGPARVVYVRSVPRSADDEPGGAFAEIWVCDRDGANRRQLTASGMNSSSPRWSPDATHLAFLSKREHLSEHTQIMVMPIDGGEPRLLTEHETSVSDFAWSPDGASIAFAATDAKSETQEEDAEAGRDWIVFGENERHRRLWMLDVASGDVRPVFDDDLTVNSFRWSPRGDQLVLQATRTPRTDDGMMYSGLYRVPAEGGTPRPIGATQGKLGEMAVSPDGRRLAFGGATSLNDPLPQSVLVVDVAGGTPRNLTEGLEASLQGLAWTSERSLLVLLDRGTRSELASIDVDRGMIRTLARTEVVVSGLEWNADSNQFAVLASAADHPTEVFVPSGEGGGLRRLTRSNPMLETVRLARQEEFTWTSTDGWEMAGVLTYPVEPGPGPHPLIVNPHGGPEGVSQLGFNTLPQILAARGYLVFQPNYRGSAGRGVAFSKGDHDDLGGQEFRDILFGIDAFIDRGLADADRVGIGGWSYGGYLSAFAGTYHSERFKAAVMGAGISNWVSFMGTTDIPHEMSIVHWNFFWRDNPELYWSRSPLSAINKASTPMLILHGAEDLRVPPGQAFEMHEALREREIPTQLVLYPRAPHGVSERAHRIDMYQRHLDWFDRYVRLERD